MLRVTFYEDSRTRLSSFVAAGHADSADYGDDVVCAAVSAILQAARLGLEAFLRLDLDVEQTPGSMRVAWPAEANDDQRVQAIVSTADLAVRQIARQYPQHVRHERTVRA